MEELQKDIIRKVMEARSKPGFEDLDPDSPDALIHGSGTVQMTQEEMQEFMANIQSQLKEAAKAPAPAVISLALYVLIATVMFGFAGLVVYRLIKNARGKDLKQQTGKPKPKSKDSKRKSN